MGSPVYGGSSAPPNNPQENISKASEVEDVSPKQPAPKPERIVEYPPARLIAEKPSQPPTFWSKVKSFFNF